MKEKSEKQERKDNTPHICIPELTDNYDELFKPFFVLYELF